MILKVNFFSIHLSQNAVGGVGGHLRTGGGLNGNTVGPILKDSLQSCPASLPPLSVWEGGGRWLRKARCWVMAPVKNRRFGGRE
jgi:hypothetical protein